MTDFIIRKARRRDAATLAAIEEAAFATDRMSAASFRRLIASPSAALRVAVSGTGVEGYALVLFRSNSRIARLYSIAVAERARGRGIAAALLRDGERIARRRGADRLRLEVREDNLAAIRLYRRLGYQPFGRHRDYYADGADALRLERRLGKEASGEEDRSPRDSGICFPYIDSLVRPVFAARAATLAEGSADGSMSATLVTVPTTISQRDPSRTP